MRLIRSLLFFTATAVALSPVGMSVASASDVLKIKRGKWENVTTITSNMLGNQTKTDSECFTEDFFDPNQMMKGMPADQCTVETDVDGATMTFSFACDMNGGAMQGAGQVVVEGETTAEGSMSMSGDMGGGVKLDMQVKSVGRWIGEC